MTQVHGSDTARRMGASRLPFNPPILDVAAAVGDDLVPMTLTWKDSEEIAWALMDQFPDLDPLKLSFPKLHKMVCELEDFSDSPEASNEKVLENIQMAWFEEKKG